MAVHTYVLTGYNLSHTEVEKLKASCDTPGAMYQEHTKCTLCIFLPLSFLLSAFPSHSGSLPSINDKTLEMCASSNVWIHFSFCLQSKEAVEDNPATLPCLEWSYVTDALSIEADQVKKV